jgi:hypothetical protein
MEGPREAGRDRRLGPPGFARPGKEGSRPREREEWHARTGGPRIYVGRARDGGKGSPLVLPIFVFFSFSKMWNSISFCLFQWNFCKAPKRLKIFVKPLYTVYYLVKI